MPGLSGCPQDFYNSGSVLPGRFNLGIEAAIAGSLSARHNTPMRSVPRNGASSIGRIGSGEKINVCEEVGVVQWRRAVEGVKETKAAKSTLRGIDYDYFPAKHESMTNAAKLNPSRADGNASGLPRSSLLIRRLRALIEGELGRILTFEDLSRLANQPRTTLCNWFNGQGEPSSEVLLRMIELVPEAKRAVLNKPPFCRTCPQIDHPFLVHDPVAVSYLRTIASETKGLSVVQSDRDDLVTFVATALGRHVSLNSRSPRQLMGIDVHAADWFVPVPGLIYLNNAFDPKLVRRALDEAWPAIEASKAALIIFNGLQACIPDLVQSASKLACRSHVILATAGEKRVIRPFARNLEFRHLTVSPDRNQPDRIRVEFHKT